MSTTPDSSASEPSSSVRPLIPKWPFIVGDAMLVLVALALFATAGTLSEAQMLFCLGSVALGGVLLATPYALEAFPPAAWGIFSGTTRAGAGGAGSSPDGELRRQTRAAAEAVEHAARANAALEASARRIDARFAPLMEIQKNLEAVAAELREAVTARQTAAAGEAQALQKDFDRLRKEQAEKFKTTETKIIALEETLTVIASHLKILAAKPEPAAAAAPARSRRPEPVAVVSAPVEEPALAAVAVAESASLGSIAVAEPAENFAPTPAEPAPTESAPVEKAPDEPESMLAKALATAQPAAETPAVSGIIQSRPRRSRKSKPHLPLDAVSAPVVAPPVAGEATSEEMAVEGTANIQHSTANIQSQEAEMSATADSPTAAIGSPETIISKPETAAPEETASSLRRSARAKAIALREDDEGEKVTPTIFTPPPQEPAGQADGPTQGELLAREAEAIRRKRSTKSPLHLPTLTARVLIGIGNKPFLRGDGPGLSPDKGVPMEFVEIGQWRWVAPKESSGPITLHILKNDEIPAEGGPITLKPGQSLEVSPVFPS
ncbi:MAG TPA: hypothetical protein VHC95_12825 [Opitutales bacterium]|nr:hypothetical protein [Opitutales bacterium]